MAGPRQACRPATSTGELKGSFTRCLNRLRLAPLPEPPPRLFLGGGHERMLTLAGRLADAAAILSLKGARYDHDPTARSG